MLVKADLRHIIDSPKKVLKLLSKIETRKEVHSKKQRIDVLQSFKIDGLSALLKEQVEEVETPAPTWHGWSKIEDILNQFGGSLSDVEKTLLLFGLLKGFNLNVYICIGQDYLTGERKTWVLEIRNYTENQIEIEAPETPDEDFIYENVFKVEK